MIGNSTGFSNRISKLEQILVILQFLHFHKYEKKCPRKLESQTPVYTVMLQSEKKTAGLVNPGI